MMIIKTVFFLAILSADELSDGGRGDGTGDGESVGADADNDGDGG